jgi:hypothetical protein
MKSALFAVPLLALPCLAQGVSVALATDGPVAVVAQAAGQSQHDFVAAGTPITGHPGNLDVSARVSVGSDYASAVTLAYPQVTGRSVAILHRGYARGPATNAAGSSASTSSQGAVQGACSFLVSITGPAGIAGAVTLSWHGAADPSARIAGSIDIGNDGSPEWTGGVGAERQRFAATLGGAPLLVRVTIDGQAAGAGGSIFVDEFADLFLGFEEDRTSVCAFTLYGQSCGPVLTGASTTGGGQHALALTLSGGFPNALALAIAGDARLALPLGLGCSLYTDVEVARVVSTDASGAAQDLHTIPSTALGTLYFQMLPFEVIGGQLVLRATNRVQLDCRR